MPGVLSGAVAVISSAIATLSLAGAASADDGVTSAPARHPVPGRAGGPGRRARQRAVGAAAGDHVRRPAGRAPQGDRHRDRHRRRRRTRHRAGPPRRAPLRPGRRRAPARHTPGHQHLARPHERADARVHVLGAPRPDLTPVGCGSAPDGRVRSSAPSATRSPCSPAPSSSSTTRTRRWSSTFAHGRVPTSSTAAITPGEPCRP